jgi:class 3 adenylate cyclase
MEKIDIPDSLHGHRALAAIVFSDIVDFSARVGQDEEHALKLVRRDLDIMKGMCEKHEGQVLKTTGDGLLMFFSSAVQAVACAQEIQEGFAEMEKKLSAKNTLRHRIGIHLGDVFVSETDVMGDGVNIAARIQAEAAPGGICISQTVYDVVKNRLEIKTTYLGPRELKNIKEAVPVYRILLAAQGAGAAPAATTVVKAAGGIPRWAKITLYVLGALVLLHILGRIGRKGQKPEEKPPVAEAPETATPVVPGKPEKPVKPKKPPRKIDPDNERRELGRKYDFEGMVEWVKKQEGLKGTPRGENLIQRYEKLASLFRWFEREMDRYSKLNPLQVNIPKRAGGGLVEVWKLPDGRYAAKRGNNVQQLKLEELKPPLVASAIRDAIHNSNVHKFHQSKLGMGLAIFISEYKLAGTGFFDGSGRRHKPPRKK